MRRWLKYSVAGAAVLSAAATGAVAFLAGIFFRIGARDTSFS